MMIKNENFIASRRPNYTVRFLRIYIIFRPLLFSAHFSYGKGKYLNQTVFLQNLPGTKIIFNFMGVTHRVQLT